MDAKNAYQLARKIYYGVEAIKTPIDCTFELEAEKVRNSLYKLQTRKKDRLFKTKIIKGGLRVCRIL